MPALTHSLQTTPSYSSQPTGESFHMPYIYWYLKQLQIYSDSYCIAQNNGLFTVAIHRSGAYLKCQLRCLIETFHRWLLLMWSLLVQTFALYISMPSWVVIHCSQLMPKGKIEATNEKHFCYIMHDMMCFHAGHIPVSYIVFLWVDWDSIQSLI